MLVNSFTVERTTRRKVENKRPETAWIAQRALRRRERQEKGRRNDEAVADEHR